MKTYYLNTYDPESRFNLCEKCANRLFRYITSVMENAGFVVIQYEALENHNIDDTGNYKNAEMFKIETEIISRFIPNNCCKF